MTIRYLTIHCAATIEGRPHTADEIRRWDVERFGQPSYHLVVELDGSYHRHLDDAQRGAHVAGRNTGNIGICYIGGLGRDGAPKDTRTANQRQTLRSLVATFRQRYPGIVVRGHRDWSPDLDHDGKIEPHEWLKVCPCFDVATQL